MTSCHQLITILLKAADNGVLLENNLKTILLPGTDTRKIFEFMCSALMSHPALKLSQQIEHSMPLMTAMARRIQDLESEVQSLKQLNIKRDRQGEEDLLPDQRTSKKHDKATSQTHGLFAAKSTLPDQNNASNLEPGQP